MMAWEQWVTVVDEDGNVLTVPNDPSKRPADPTLAELQEDDDADRG